MSPDDYHHGDLRRALLSAARGALAEGPAADLSLRELSRRVGVSHAAPYRHFVDHGALLEAVTAEVLGDLAVALEGAVRRATDAEDALRACARAYASFVIDRPGEAALIVATPKHQRAEGAPARVAGHRAFGVLVGAIAQASDAGTFAATTRRPTR